MLEVFVQGLEVYAYHGVPEEERAVGHRYRIDLLIEVDGSADRTDQIGDTVNYALAAEIALEIAREEKFHTVERLAGQIADRLLERLELATAVEVTVAKPMPPTPVIADSAGVTLRRTRA